MSASIDLTPRYVRSVVDHFAARVAAEQDRVAAEMRAAFPHCSIFCHTYDVAYHLKHPGLWGKEDVALAFVQCRTSSGTVHSAIVKAGFGTGEAWVTGWPPEEGSGRVRREAAPTPDLDGAGAIARLILGLARDGRWLVPP